MPFQNVNVAKFTFILSIKLPKLPISNKKKLSIILYYFQQITHLQSIQMYLKNVNVGLFKSSSSIKMPKLKLFYKMHLVISIFLQNYTFTKYSNVIFKC